MDRKQQLEQKTQELGQQLEQWATQHGLLLADEKLVVSVEVRVNPKQETALVFPRAKRSRYDLLERDLDSTDWEIILGLPWNAPQKALMESFHTSGNKPMKVEDEKRKQTFSSARADLVNGVFRNNGNAYRLLSTVPRSGWRYPIKIYAIEPKA